MDRFSDRIKAFNRGLCLENRLPMGVSVLNPYQDNPHVLAWADAFYDRFFSDKNPRSLILGINPGRLGAGQTGIPFTDPKRLSEYFQLGESDNLTHETSSAFIYKMIDAYGGVEIFYRDFLVSSICPLGFVSRQRGKEVNYNYYDSPQLIKAVTPFIVRSIEEQLSWPIRRDVVFCLGTGKNLKFMSELNAAHSWFDEIVPLEHPRYIMQYKSKHVQSYIEKYLRALRDS